MTKTMEIRAPQEQQEGSRYLLQSWMKQQGDSVKAHEPIAELETDKVVVEMAAPADGVLQILHKQPGDELAPGELVATLLLRAAQPAAPAAVTTDRTEAAAVTTDRTEAAAAVSPLPDAPVADEPVPPGRTSVPPSRTSPAVRRMLRERGLAVDQIAGTGRAGRVTARDVEAHLRAPGPGAAATASAGPAGAIRSHAVPHDSMRRRIAEHMLRSVQTAPHVTTVFEADLSAVLAHKARTAPELARLGPRLTLTAYFVAASALAMRKVPAVNSRWHTDHLEVYDDINIGIGTSLGASGLVVPVLRNTQDKDLYQLAEGLEQLTEKARLGTLSPAEVQGGTFTISNHGVSGSLLASPIVIHQPQSAILGVGKLEKRVIVREIAGQDCIQVRPMCYLTLTLDHRVLDAFQANLFLSAVVALLESWPLDSGGRLPEPAE